MWALAVLVYLAAAFHRNGLAVASLTAERRFGIGPSELSFLVAVQIALYAALQIPTGAMADRFGPRRLLVAAALVMAGGELLFAVAGDAGVALVGRGLVGVGDALTFLSVLRLVHNWFPVTRYGLLAALTALVGSAGQLVSTVPLHVGLVHLGWTSTFGLTALLTAGIGGLVWGILRDEPPAGDGPWRAVPAPRRRGEEFGRSVRAVMRVPGTWQAMWAHFALTGAFVVFTALWGYPFLVRAQHLDGAAASSALALVVVSAGAVAPVVGLVMVRRPAWKAGLVTGCGLVLLATWLAVLALRPGHDPAWLVVVLLVVTGAAGPCSAPAFDMARAANAGHRSGAATGVVNIGGFTSAVAADLAIGAILAGAGHGRSSAAGFLPALSVIPALVGVGLVGFWWFGRLAARRGPGEQAIGSPVAPSPREARP